MPRVTRGSVRRAKRKKALARTKGFYATKSKLYRAAKEAADKALEYAYVGRRLRKRDFRRLWIIRINAGARQHGLSYSQFMNGLSARWAKAVGSVAASWARLLRSSVTPAADKPFMNWL